MKTLQNTCNLAVSKILGHPDNPRKNLGDLSELTQSIKENGILQDITVIPDYCYYRDKEAQEAPTDDMLSDITPKFYVLMGHRRFEAAKEAGLESICCKIAYELSKSEQIAIMLEENIQRNELTVPEQIEAFQLMLDLGETVETLADKTGFSKSTIYKRVKNADIVDSLKEKEDYQLTISDLEELAKVDTEEKEKILKRASSSSDIRQAVHSAIEKKERLKKQHIVIQALEARGVTRFDEDAEEIYGSRWNLDHVTSISIDQFDKTKLKLVGNEYYIEPYDWESSIEIRCPSKIKEEEEETEEERAEQEKRERIQENEETIGDIISELKTHIKDFTKVAARGDINIEFPDNMGNIIKDLNLEVSPQTYIMYMEDMNRWEIKKEDIEKIGNVYSSSIELFVLTAMVWKLQEGRNLTNYQGKYLTITGNYWMKVWGYLNEMGFLKPEISAIPDGENIENILDGTSSLYEEDEDD